MATFEVDGVTVRFRASKKSLLLQLAAVGMILIRLE